MERYKKIFKEGNEVKPKKPKSIEQLKTEIDKVIKTASKRFSSHSDSERAKETKYYNQLEDRYIKLCELLVNHPDFKKSGLDKDVYAIDSFGEYVF